MAVIFKHVRIFAKSPENFAFQPNCQISFAFFCDRISHWVLELARNWRFTSNFLMRFQLCDFAGATDWRYERPLPPIPHRLLQIALRAFAMQKQSGSRHCSGGKVAASQFESDGFLWCVCRSQFEFALLNEN